MTKGTLAKSIMAAFAGLGASFFQAYGPIFLCVCVAICLDVITGLVKAKATGEAISSTVGTIGFWKKMALFFALAFGIFLDTFIPLMLDVVTVNLPFKMPIGMIVGCYIVINESISIFENINKAAPTALPKWIKKILKGAGETIDKGGESNGNDKSGKS